MKRCTDPSCRLLAAQYLRKQCKQLMAQFPGVREATDIECIHHARVASRRLRAALGIFGECLPQKPLARWKKQVRRVTKGLGAARDLDVQREYLVEVMTQLADPAGQPGIARLLVRTDLERDRIQQRVLKALRRLEKSDTLQDMRKALKPLSESGGDDNPLQSPACRGMAEYHIRECLSEMLLLEDSLEDPKDCQQHHAMRIAAKRLRYTMEICRPVYGQPIDAALESAKRLQSLLGDVHDCDVWIEKLPQMLEEERQWIVECYGHAGPLERLKAGVDYLVRRRQEQRHERFIELVQFWQEQSRRGTWPQLVELLDKSSTTDSSSCQQSSAEESIMDPSSSQRTPDASSGSAVASTDQPQSQAPTDGNGASPPHQDPVSNRHPADNHT